MLWCQSQDGPEEMAKFAQEYGELCTASVRLWSALDSVQFQSMSILCHPAFTPPADFSFPYLYDETQDVAKNFNAVCTPDIFLYDADRRLQYRGQFDDSRPSNNQASTGENYAPAQSCEALFTCCKQVCACFNLLSYCAGNDLRSAIQQVLEGKSIEQQKPSIGCRRVRSVCIPSLSCLGYLRNSHFASRCFVTKRLISCRNSDCSCCWAAASSGILTRLAGVRT